MVVACDDPAVAAAAVGRLPALTAIDRTVDGLRLTLAEDDRAVIADVTRALVAADVAVYAIRPVRRTLEERFLELTTPGATA